VAGPYDLVVGNPPYGRALEFVRRGIELGRCVVYLLRLGFMASGDRAEFFSRHPPAAVWVVAHRPSFTADGQCDSSDYGWFCWRRGADQCRLYWLPTVPLEQRKGGW